LQHESGRWVLTDITTGGDGIETTPVDSLHSGLEVLLDDTVELEGLDVSAEYMYRDRENLPVG
jgi:hypothetical protein